MQKDINSWQAHLPFERLQKMYAYRNISDRWLCAATYRLLQHGLSNEYGIDKGDIQIKFAPSGKPALSGISNIYFSISHCDTGAVCALSNEEIGVDIEDFSQQKQQVMKYALNDDEYEMVMSSQYPDKVFTYFWTLKESWLKATGLGLGYDTKQLLINLTTSRPCVSQGGFIAKIAWENERGCIAQCCKKESLLPVCCCSL